MKKFIGIGAIALLIGASAFASQIDYELQLGGDNHVQSIIDGNGVMPYTDGTTGDTTTVDPAASTILSWAVKVQASGQYTPPGGTTPVDIMGAANLVWDLKLYGFNATANDYDDVAVGTDATVGNTGSSVATAFGKGDASTTGFYSTMNVVAISGELHLSAFAFSYNLSGSQWATIKDTVATGGPDMARWQYPTTLGTGYNGEANAACTAKSGTLMGMGAGYTQFDNDSFAGAGTEHAGVGIPGAVSDCALGAVVVAEGQMNLANLPAGKYKLRLFPGKGNNVLRSDFAAACIGVASGNFAVAADTVNGDSILFTIIGQPKAQVTVNCAPAGAVAAGANFSITGVGGPYASGTSVEVDAIAAPGYTVTFGPATGYTAPASQTTGALAGGGSVTLTGTYTLIPPAPAVVSAKTMRTHTGATGPFGIEFLVPQLSGKKLAESRFGGPNLIWVKYDKALDGVTLPTATVNGVAATVAFQAADTVAISGFAAQADRTCCAIVINGAKAADGGTQTVAQTLNLQVRYGDVNGDGKVNSDDTVAVKAGAQPTAITEAKAMLDLNLDRKVNSDDTVIVKSKASPMTTPTCP